jgi:signal transduction histidine kinase
VFRLATKQYAVSLGLWLFTAPFMVVGLVFTELSEAWEPTTVIQVLIAGAISHLAIGLVFFIASRTVLSPARRGSAGWKQVVPVYVLAGVVRGVAIGLVVDAFGVGETDFVTRITTAIILIVFSFIVGAYSAQLWREYRAKRVQLLTSIAVGEKTDSLRGIASGEFRPLALGELEADVLKAREQTKTTLQSIRDRVRSENVDPAFIQQVFEASDGNWRDLSHKAWVAALPNVPKITVVELAKTLASSRPISLLVLTAGPVYGFTRIFDSLPFLTAVLGGLLWWVGVIGIALATNSLAAKTREVGIYVLLAGYLAIQLCAALVGQVLLGGSSNSEILFVSLVSSTLAITLGLPPALERTGQLVLAQLEKRLDNTAIENLKAQGEMFVLAQRIGSYLHSEVRGDFLRHSLALREALEQGETNKAEQILDQLDELVGAINLEQGEQSPLENLNTFLNNWSGLIAVKHNLDTLGVSEQFAGSVQAILMEAVNNAVRHGKASWVTIEVSETPRSLELQIDSNSEPFSENPQQGLGSKSLDRLAPGSWSWQFIERVGASPFLRLKVSLTPTNA